jgi:predicted MFS family arabinose efflux permease
MTITALINPFAPFRIALRARNLRLLLTGLATSQAGDWLYNLALLAFVYERTGSTAWVGITTAARILPEVALGPLGGVLADRHDRRAIMIASDVLRAATMGALALLAIAGGPILLAPVLAALCTAAGAAYPQCVVALLPRLVADEDLPAANAARISITHLCVIGGPILGAVLLVLGSPAATFAVNGGSFLAGAVIVAALPRAAFRRPAGVEPAAPARLRDELATGWHALREHPTALPLVGVEIVASAIYGASTVLFVLLAVRLGLGAAGYGYLLSAMGAGGILAAGAASAAAASKRPQRALLGAVVAFGLSLPLLALTGSVPAAIALVAIIGAGMMVSEVGVDTILQRSLDPAVFARAYGLVVPACVAAIVAGALLAPLAVSLLGLDATLAITGAAVLAYAALAARSGLERDAHAVGRAQLV